MDTQIYCLKCKKKTTINLRLEKNSKGKNTLKGTCSICGTKKNKFIKKGSGWTDLPFHLQAATVDSETPKNSAILDILSFPPTYHRIMRSCFSKFLDLLCLVLK